MQKKSKKGVGQNKNFGKLTFCGCCLVQTVFGYTDCEFLDRIANTSWDKTW
jgi:hypothetical protein